MDAGATDEINHIIFIILISFAGGTSCREINSNSPQILAQTKSGFQIKAENKFFPLFTLDDS